MTEEEFKEKFWKSIKSDRTIMLGLANSDGLQFKPMTALIEDEEGPMWIFSSAHNSIVKQLEKNPSSAAVANFASKGHDVFATIQGKVRIDNDKRVIDRLWCNMVAAWYEGGKQDPNLRLLRLDPEKAEIWKDASSLVTGIELLLGINPKNTVKDDVRKVAF